MGANYIGEYSASVPLKGVDYNAEVEIINPVADTVAPATFQGTNVDWYIKADDIVLKIKTVSRWEIRRTIASMKSKQIRKYKKALLL